MPWDLPWWRSAAAGLNPFPPPCAQTKYESEFVPRDTEKSEFLDLADFEGVAISVETVILQPIEFGMPFNLNLQSQSNWSLFNGTWQTRSREQDYRLRFKIKEMTLQM